MKNYLNINHLVIIPKISLARFCFCDGGESNPYKAAMLSCSPLYHLNIFWDHYTTNPMALGRL